VSALIIQGLHCARVALTLPFAVVEADCESLSFFMSPEANQDSPPDAGRPARKKVVRRSGHSNRTRSDHAGKRQEEGGHPAASKKKPGRARRQKQLPEGGQSQRGKESESLDTGGKEPHHHRRGHPGKADGDARQEKEPAQKKDSLAAAAPAAQAQTAKRPEHPRNQQGGQRDIRSLDPTAEWHEKAWEIFRTEISEEGGTMINDHDLKELSKRAFHVARIFIEERDRNRRF